MATAWWESGNENVKHQSNLVHYKPSRKSMSVEDYNKLEREMRNNHNDIILSKDTIGDLCLIPPSKVDISFNYNSVKNKSRPTTPAAVFNEPIKIPTGDIIPETRNPPPTPTRKLSLESNDVKGLFTKDTYQRPCLNSRSEISEIRSGRSKVRRATTPVIPKTDADFVELPHTQTKYPTSGSMAGSLLTCRRVHHQTLLTKRANTPPTRHLLQPLDVKVPDNQVLQGRKRPLPPPGRDARSVSRLIAAGKWEDYNKSRTEQKIEQTTTSPPVPDVETKSLHSKVATHNYTPIQHMRQSSATRRNRSRLHMTPLQHDENKEKAIITPDIRSINYRTSGSLEVLKSLEETLGHQPASSPFVYFKHNYTASNKSRKFLNKWLAAGPTNVSFANS